MPSDTKHRRRHNHSKTKWQAFLLCLFLVLVLAAVVGLILALNSKMFVEAG